MKILFVLLLLAISCTLVFGQDHSFSKEVDTPSNVSGPLLTDEEKEKIARDAQKLTEDFSTIVDDLSSLGQKIGHSFVDTLSVWINENYRKLSESQRERLKKFIIEMKEQLQDLEKMSVNNLAKILNKLKGFLRELEMGGNPTAPENNESDGQVI
jgi:hypothetical protein